jgi:hypothetical protein
MGPIIAVNRADYTTQLMYVILKILQLVKWKRFVNVNNNIGNISAHDVLLTRKILGRRQPGDLGSFGESSMASRRKRGPLTLRPRLWSGLPLSEYQLS